MSDLPLLQPDAAALAFMARAVCGAPVDEALLAGFTPTVRRVCEATLRANGAGRTLALRQAVARFADGADVLRAILATDPDEPLPGCSSWADLDGILAPLVPEWAGWLWRGCATMVAAQSGEGRSFLLLRIAASFVRGDPWPDGTAFTGRLGKVLWCESEGAQALNLERATRMGLPLDAFITPLPDPLQAVQLDDPEHLALVAAAARRPDVRLVVVDSLKGATVRSRENDSEAIAPVMALAELARDRSLPVLLSHHLRKRGQMDAVNAVTLDQVRGSTALVQPCRVVWALDHPDPLDPAHKRLAVIKSNLGRFPAPVGVTFGGSGVTFGRAPEPLRRETQADRAVDVVRAFLSAGPRPATEVFDECRQAGISERTVSRAKDKLGIVASKRGNRGGWLWSLPVPSVRETDG